MKQRVERNILLAIAGVSASAPFVLDPFAAGMILAALNVALALCAGLPER
jgi:hypothetical protein